MAIHGIPIYPPEARRWMFYEYNVKITESDTEEGEGRVWYEETVWDTRECFVKSALAGRVNEYGSTDKWYHWEWEWTGKEHKGIPPNHCHSTMHC